MKAHSSKSAVAKACVTKGDEFKASFEGAVVKAHVTEDAAM